MPFAIFRAKAYTYGARTLSHDPEWKYVNVRHLFIFLQQSIAKGTQWVVVEPNGESLWRQVQQSMSDFLLDLWRTGAVPGAKPDEAFFIRCDRTTMLVARKPGSVLGRRP